MKIVPHLDRSDLVGLTTHTVLHNLTEGIILVAVILFAFLGNIRGALIVTLTIPFSLLFASICLDLRQIPANLLSLGALDFGMIVEGAIVMVENIVRSLSHPRGMPTRAFRSESAKPRTKSSDPVFYAITIIITAYLPIFTLQRVEGRLFKPMAWTVAFALLGGLAVFDVPRARDGEHRLSERRERMAQPGDGMADPRLSILPEHRDPMEAGDARHCARDLCRRDPA